MVIVSDAFFWDGKVDNDVSQGAVRDPLDHVEPWNETLGYGVDIVSLQVQYVNVLSFVCRVDFHSLVNLLATFLLQLDSHFLCIINLFRPISLGYPIMWTDH
jgi:hypothetical protein